MVAAIAVSGCTTAAAPGPACAPIEVVVARETSAPPNTSVLLSAVVHHIEAQHPGQTSVYHVQYPASADFASSAPAGTADLVHHLDAQAVGCPGQRSVLLGYSQGAWVVTDALAEPTDRLGVVDAGPLTPAAAAGVAAVVVYGNPRFVGGEPWDAGTFDPARDGVIPRARGALAPYGNRLRDICLADDWVCQRGGNMAAHLGYLAPPWVTDGTDFALARLT